MPLASQLADLQPECHNVVLHLACHFVVLLHFVDLLIACPYASHRVDLQPECHHSGHASCMPLQTCHLQATLWTYRLKALRGLTTCLPHCGLRANCGLITCHLQTTLWTYSLNAIVWSYILHATLWSYSTQWAYISCHLHATLWTYSLNATMWSCSILWAYIMPLASHFVVLQPECHYVVLRLACHTVVLQHSVGLYHATCKPPCALTA